jgi:hypothetical protein
VSHRHPDPPISFSDATTTKLRAMAYQQQYSQPPSVSQPKRGIHQHAAIGGPPTAFDAPPLQRCPLVNRHRADWSASCDRFFRTPTLKKRRKESEVSLRMRIRMRHQH